MSNTYYVYALLDPRKPATKAGQYDYGIGLGFSHEPFYIGYGQRCRSEAHAQGAFKKKPDGSYVDKTRKANKIRKILSEGHEVIVVRTENTTKNVSKAKRCEIRLIAAIGRLDREAGPLTNSTDGGDGLTNPSAKVRAKMSKAHTGKVLSAETRAKMSAYKKTDEHRRKLGEAHLGLTHSEETKARISAAKKGQGLGSKHTEEALAKMRGAKSPAQVANMKKARQARAERERNNPLNGKKVYMNGKVYKSVVLAAEVAGIKHNSLLYRIQSPNFPEVYYV